MGFEPRTSRTAASALDRMATAVPRQNVKLFTSTRFVKFCFIIRIISFFSRFNLFKETELQDLIGQNK